jgi:hypothetical protein
MLLTTNKNKMIIMLTELYKMLKYNKLYICRKIYIWQAKNKEKEWKQIIVTTNKVMMHSLIKILFLSKLIISIIVTIT